MTTAPIRSVVVWHLESTVLLVNTVVRHLSAVGPAVQDDIISSACGRSVRAASLQAPVKALANLSLKIDGDIWQEANMGASHISDLPPATRDVIRDVYARSIAGSKHVAHVTGHRRSLNRVVHNLYESMAELMRAVAVRSGCMNVVVSSRPLHEALQEMKIFGLNKYVDIDNVYSCPDSYDPAADSRAMDGIVNRVKRLDSADHQPMPRYHVFVGPPLPSQSPSLLVASCDRLLLRGWFTVTTVANGEAARTLTGHIANGRVDGIAAAAERTLPTVLGELPASVHPSSSSSAAGVGDEEAQAAGSKRSRASKDSNSKVGSAWCIHRKCVHAHRHLWRDCKYNNRNKKRKQSSSSSSSSKRHRRHY
eukprot:TRINITY_DN66428_c8_g15_i1.p1 TRINITY_DN66428_c8_g15~~TRINITY_DN66428_c8_g15_i1.p1  ORF type:complete len:407 (+),score=177.56 TRINITY_DN66428_c8_g15_i1:128-1222(+)